MSSSENTRSATTLQLAGLNCILLLLPKVISACFKWSATVALLKMDLLQLMQVHLIFNRILLASSSESILVLGLLCSWTNFPLSKSKATFFEGESRGPIRFVTPPVGTPRWSSSTSSTFNSHLWCFSGSKFDKCAIFSRALPLLKTPCPSNRLGFVFSLVGRRWLATSDFSTLPTTALLRSPLDLAVILFEGRFSGRFPFQTGNLLVAFFTFPLLVLPILAAPWNLDGRIREVVGKQFIPRTDLTDTIQKLQYQKEIVCDLNFNEVQVNYDSRYKEHRRKWKWSNGVGTVKC